MGAKMLRYVPCFLDFEHVGIKALGQFDDGRKFFVEIELTEAEFDDPNYDFEGRARHEVERQTPEMMINFNQDHENK